MPPRAHHNTNEADPLQLPSVQAALFEHVTMLPPHGPFAYLSALTASLSLSQGGEAAEGSAEAKVLAPAFRPPPVDVAPQHILEFFQSQWNVDHLRHWPALYAAAEARLQNR